MAANSESQWKQHVNGTQHMELMRKQMDLSNELNSEYYEDQPPQGPMHEFYHSSLPPNLTSVDGASTFSMFSFAGLGSSEYDHASKRMKLEETTLPSTPSPSLPLPLPTPLIPSTTPATNIINYPALDSLYYSPTPLSMSTSKFFCAQCNVPCNSQG